MIREIHPLNKFQYFISISSKLIEYQLLNLKHSEVKETLPQRLWIQGLIKWMSMICFLLGFSFLSLALSLPIAKKEGKSLQDNHTIVFAVLGIDYASKSIIDWLRKRFEILKIYCKGMGKQCNGKDKTLTLQLILSIVAFKLKLYHT